MAANLFVRGHPALCIVSGLVSLAACIMLLVSSAVITSNVSYLHSKWSQLLGLSIATIVATSLGIIFTIGYLFVVIRKFPALTALLSILLLITTIMTAVVAIVAAASIDHIRVRAYYQMESLITGYSDLDTVKSTKALVGEIQQKMECCGVDKATDWKYAGMPDFKTVMGAHLAGKRATTETGLDGTSTPDSCCHEVTRGCGKGALIRQDSIYLDGCAESVAVFFHKRYVTLIGMGFTVAAVTLITAVAGIVYERFLRQQYEQM